MEKIKEKKLYIVLLLLLSSCTYQSDVTRAYDEHLAAAGFSFFLKDSAPYQLLLHRAEDNILEKFMSQSGQIYYVYLDRNICHCVFMGYEKNYQSIHQFHINEMKQTSPDLLYIP